MRSLLWYIKYNWPCSPWINTKLAITRLPRALINWWPWSQIRPEWMHDMSPVLPGGSNDGGIQSSVAGQSHSYGDGPAHYPQGVVRKRLVEKKEHDAAMTQPSSVTFLPKPPEPAILYCSFPLFQSRPLFFKKVNFRYLWPACTSSPHKV